MLLEAAGSDPVLKFALLSGFDAGLRREEISEARVGWFDLELNKYRYDTNKRVRSHIKRCGIKCSIHDMHRSFASMRVSDGTSIYKVARWLGDGIVVTARSYGHLEPQDDEINRGI
jgi:hypothetical protein